MKTKYRAIKERFYARATYSVQAKYWFCPFWITIKRPFETLTEANRFINRKINKRR